MLVLSSKGIKKEFDKEYLKQHIFKLDNYYRDKVDASKYYLQDISKIRECISTIVDDVEKRIHSNTEIESLWKLITNCCVDRFVENLLYDYLALIVLLNKISKEVYFKNCYDDYSKERDAVLTIETHDEYYPFDYNGLYKLYDMYLLRDDNGFLQETTEGMFVRVCSIQGLGDFDETCCYSWMRNLVFLPSSPVLFHANTHYKQHASCFINVAPDSLNGLMDMYKDCANLSKRGGGLGTSYHNVRALGSKIKGTGGISNGVIPFLKIHESLCLAVNQGGKRKGAMACYLPVFHADIYDFLEARKKTGDHNRITEHISLAVTIPDCFMEAVQNDDEWYLFETCEELLPKDKWTKGIITHNYKNQVRLGNYVKKTRARDLFKKIVETSFRFGKLYAFFIDTVNNVNPNRDRGVVYSSNLCTEITLNTSDNLTAVCNLASINLKKFVKIDNDNKAILDADLLENCTKMIVRYLTYAIVSADIPNLNMNHKNKYEKPLGIGVMGFYDLVCELGLSYGSEEANRLLESVMNIIYNSANSESKNCTLGNSQEYYTINHLNTPYKVFRRHSNLLAIAPNATISTIAGVQPNLEAPESHYQLYATQSGHSVQINRYLQQELDKFEDIKKCSDVNPPKKYENLIKKYPDAFQFGLDNTIERTAIAQKWVDQSISTNLFIETRQEGSFNISELGKVWIKAWKLGLKTLYYTKSKGASQSTVSNTSCSINDSDCVSCQ